MTSGICIMVWDLNPKTLPIIHVKPFMSIEYVMHKTDKYIDKLAKSGIMIGFKKYNSFALYFAYIYSGLRNYIICKEKCYTWKWTNIFNFLNGSVQTLMCTNCKQQFYVVQYTMTCYILVTIETTKQHGNLNLFSFQCDGMWPVNMTSEPTGWPIKSQNTPNIIGWLTLISSPIDKIFYSCASIT